MASITDDAAQLADGANQMAMRVGQVMGLWAELEDFTMRLFSATMNQPIPVASAILSGIMNSYTRLEILNSVCSIVLKDKPELQFWRSLRDYIRELSEDRNNIAHSPPMVDGKRTCGRTVGDAPYRR